MISIPDDLVNAARFDGASEFRIYRTVMLPLVKPPLVTRAVLPGIVVHVIFQRWIIGGIATTGTRG